MGAVNFFFKGTDSKYFTFCRPLGFRHIHSPLPLDNKSRHRQYINEWAWLCSSTTSFTKTGSWPVDHSLHTPVYSMILSVSYYIDLVQLSCLVMSSSLRPHESQHARPPCPSSTPGVYSNSCPSNQWCHPAISSSVVPFSSCPQSLPASGSFPMNQLFTYNPAIPLLEI